MDIVNQVTAVSFIISIILFYYIIKRIKEMIALFNSGSLLTYNQVRTVNRIIEDGPYMESRGKGGEKYPVEVDKRDEKRHIRSSRAP